MKVSEQEAFALSGKDWVKRPRIARTIPFGYMVHEDEPETLYPVVFELEALEVAIKHLKNGHSLRRVAVWLTEVTGRHISHEGLKKRMKLDSTRRRKAVVLKNWAKAAQEALEKAYKFDRRVGNDLSEYPEEFVKEFLRREEEAQREEASRSAT